MVRELIQDWPLVISEDFDLQQVKTTDERFYFAATTVSSHSLMEYDLIDYQLCKSPASDSFVWLPGDK